ncbi:MAG: hypothetical protein V4526_03125 [Patescibacteria group bacterium]
MFDLTFFKFLFGFLFILSLSFAVLFFVGVHLQKERTLAESRRSKATGADISVVGTTNLKTKCLTGKTC